jgi:hypothetical protein
MTDEIKKETWFIYGPSAAVWYVYADDSSELSIVRWNGSRLPIATPKDFEEFHNESYQTTKENALKHLEQVKATQVARQQDRAFCPGASPPDNSCSPSNKGDVSYNEKAGSLIRSMGIEADDVVALAGITGGKATIEVTDRGAIRMQARSDVAGVQDGLKTVLSVKNLGTSENPEIAVEYEMIDVAKEIKGNPASRHAAARSFYRSMVEGVQHAEKIGASQVKLFAAGGVNSPEFRGHTIWPRMGFDSRIPFHRRMKMPEELQGAQTVLQLHSTRQGAAWWRDNGTGVEMTMPVGAPDSPQMKVFRKFAAKASRRSETMGSNGDGWLSPDDEAEIDAVWEEIWQEGFLLSASDGDQGDSVEE